MAAPVPRPPQPTRPILIVSLPNEWAARATFTWLAAIEAPATSSDELRMKSRREVPCGREVFFELIQFDSKRIAVGRRQHPRKGNKDIRRPDPERPGEMCVNRPSAS